MFLIPYVENGYPKRALIGERSQSAVYIGEPGKRAEELYYGGLHPSEPTAGARHDK